MDKPEPSPLEKLQTFTRQLLSVPKTEIDRREAEYQKERATWAVGLCCPHEHRNNTYLF